MPLSDLFGKLKTTIVGTKTSNIDAKLDSAVKDITAYRSNIGRNSYIELIKGMISKTGLDSQLNLSQSATTVTPAALGQGSRLIRYKSYEAIVSNINYAHRALAVLVDNILSPDDITKTSLEVQPKTFLEDEAKVESKVRNIKELIEKLKIENHLDMIAKTTLHMGDFFCEIADTKTALTSKSAILSENFYLKNSSSKDAFTIEGETSEDKNINVKVILDYSTFNDTKSDKKEKKQNIDDLHLLYYEPKRVVKLQSDMFSVCFGYLVFPATILSPHLMMQNQMVNAICQNILNSLEKKIPNITKDNINTDDLKDIVKSMILASDPSRAMNIRYVPPDKMQHFFVPSPKFYPYGESIFDSCQFTAKLIIVLETALTLFRLNRSTEKRKIAVEIGLPRDARTAIEKLKEEFRKRKVSVDSFGSVDTIPSQISSFEDIYIPQKDGKPYVDISTFNEGMVDTRGKVDEIKLLRDSLIASLMVPPAFLSLEENLSNRAALSEENILFARTIINHQKYLNLQINELLKKIYSVIDPEEALSLFDEVSVNLPAPKSLQFERQAKYMSDLANLIQTLEGIGVPKDWAKKKFLTSIDWKEVEKYEIESKIDKSLGTEKDEESGMGGMGMSGGGMGGF